MSKNHYSADNLPEPVEHPKGTRFNDRTGERHGRLTVLHYVGTRNKQPYWLCLCDCGIYTAVQGGRLGAGGSLSCGCLLRDFNRAMNTTHGGCGTPEYRSWTAMVRRCCSPTAANYHMYGGRGITVCDRWRNSFAAFREDMGPKPTPKHSIDRIDNDGNYEPGNCRWATPIQQQRNTSIIRMITASGETRCLGEWAEKTGISRETIHARLCRGWTPERALTAPVRKCRRKTQPPLLEQSCPSPANC